MPTSRQVIWIGSPHRASRVALTFAQTRYTDTHVLSRGISVKSGPMSLVLPNSKGKSSLVNIIDTPGHVNFADEVGSIARLVDGVVVVVDVVEGVMHGTEALIRHAMQEKLKMVLVVNKMDRLILELRLPPSEAFFKIKHTIEEVNSVIA
jgi:U5 small nuclear ribonucleoprotein component